jgi:hypothetical protein
MDEDEENHLHDREKTRIRLYLHRKDPFVQSLLPFHGKPLGCGDRVFEGITAPYISGDA